VDEYRARIRDDLRDLIVGDLYFDPLDRAAYARDASPYEIEPLGAVAPQTEDDVAIVVKYAADNQIPIHARGAGTDPGGGSLGPGLVVDFSRHMRRIIAIGHDRVVTEPGIVLDHLNAELIPMGRRVEIDPGDGHISTLGGMVAVDAAGANSLRHGSAGDQVDSLRAVCSDGEVRDLGFESWPTSDDQPGDFTSVLVRKLHNLYRRNRQRLGPSSPGPPRNRAGYPLERASSEAGVDLARLVAGSEGTLALVVRAAMKTRPVPGSQQVVLLQFARLNDAAAIVGRCLNPEYAPSSCDLYDWRSLSVAREADPLLHRSILEAAESIVVLEFEGDDPDEVAGRARSLIHRMSRSASLIADPIIGHRRAERDRLMGLRRLIEPGLMRNRSGARPISFIDDSSVPVETLADTIPRLQSVLKRHEVSWTLDAWAGEGRLRLRPFLDLSDPRDLAKLEPLASDVCDVVLDAGGSISSSSACGLARTLLLHRQYGDSLQTFREIKDAFDPSNILNPGKVVGDSQGLTENLIRLTPSPRESLPESPPDGRGSPIGLEVGAADGAGPDDPSGRESASLAAAGAVAASPLLPVLRWPERGLEEQASACNGCGACRTQEPTLRMCPTYRALRQESASPRSQANLIRQIATGAIDPKLWGAEEFKAHADLCFHCKMCQSECPSGVDVSSLMLEAKAAYVEQHGLAPGDWVFSRIELWARLASRLPIVTNYLLSRRVSRRVLERVLGLSRHRVLPKVRRTPFTRRAAKLGLHRPRPHLPGPRVVYFVDVFANYYDQELAESVVEVLSRAGVNVYVPIRQRSSGMAALIVGDVDHARDLALHNLRILGDAVREGYTVVCSEPTAALMLQQEYVKLTDDLDAALVAQNTMDVGHYLAGLDARGMLPAPTEPLGLRVGYHQPCHLRALNVGTPGLDLLRGIPDIRVEFIDRGCSGMGGTYGLARGRFRTSVRAGRGLLKRLRDPDIEVGATECGACRIQMEQGSTKNTIHPIKLLSLGYGLNPSIRQGLRDPKPRNAMS
jgi:FAD/FMN-containing dehydrogenase/Fe-S oxidoreductase